MYLTCLNRKLKALSGHSTLVFQMSMILEPSRRNLSTAGVGHHPDSLPRWKSMKSLRICKSWCYNRKAAPNSDASSLKWWWFRSSKLSFYKDADPCWCLLLQIVATQDLATTHVKQGTMRSRMQEISPQADSSSLINNNIINIQAAVTWKVGHLIMSVVGQVSQTPACQLLRPKIEQLVLMVTNMVKV